MVSRPERVGEENRQVLAEKLIRGTSVPLEAFATISAVEINSDLTKATVYYSLFGSDEACKQSSQVLKGDAKRFRKEIARQIKLRVIPELTFTLDTSMERASRIDELLKKN